MRMMGNKFASGSNGYQDVRITCSSTNLALLQDFPLKTAWFLRTQTGTKSLVQCKQKNLKNSKTLP